MRPGIIRSKVRKRNSSIALSQHAPPPLIGVCAVGDWSRVK